MADLQTILQAWAWPNPPQWLPIESGLINLTWKIEVSSQPIAILQRLNTQIFTPLVHEDIEAVTSHLALQQQPTPRLVRTTHGKLWHEDENSDAWRCFSWLGNRTIQQLVDPVDAFEAGALVGRFHSALRDFRWDFRSVRGAFHDTEARLLHLEQVLKDYSSHRLYDTIAPLAAAVIHQARSLPQCPNLPSRIVHGDLKISNIRYHDHQALALVDLDTLAWGTLDAELGDAFRSWCNPATENSRESNFDLRFFEAGIKGYLEGSKDVPPTQAELASLILGTERIALELAARFAADALEESYFGWDPRYNTLGEHNQLRATGQWQLANVIRANRSAAEKIIQRLTM